jgi:hypothetical protein
MIFRPADETYVTVRGFVRLFCPSAWNVFGSARVDTAFTPCTPGTGLFTIQEE